MFNIVCIVPELSNNTLLSAVEMESDQFKQKIWIQIRGPKKYRSAALAVVIRNQEPG